MQEEINWKEDWGLWDRERGEKALGRKTGETGGAEGEISASEQPSTCSELKQGRCF